MTESLNASLGVPGSSFDRVQDAIQAAGLRYKTTRGTHIQAECPTHTDANPSLSIDFKPADGATFVHCQGSCPLDDVLAAIGLTKPMLYDNYEDPDTFAARRAAERAEERRTGKSSARRQQNRARPEKPRPALPKGRLPGRLTVVEPRPLGEWSVTTTYDYCDVNGTVVHQEVRHQRPIEVVDEVTGEPVEKVEKRFTQRWPDGSNGWQDKTPKGFVPVLYRLPEIFEWISAGRRIWLCEGAKDADRFLDMGEAATTNPSGATNFKPEQAAALAGAHVIAVLDHDLAGYRRGLKLAEMLEDVRSIRFALPATTGRHQDASDHFDAAHGVGDFVEVDVDQLKHLEFVAEAEDAASLATRAGAEATARAQRAQETTAKGRSADEARFAARWAAETGKQLTRATSALEAAFHEGAVDPEARQRLVAAVETAQAATRAAHSVAEVEIPNELEIYLQDVSVDELEQEQGHTAEADDQGQGGQVVEHPTANRFPEPSSRIPMSRGVWAYELGGEGRRSRGVYLLNDSRWTKIAPLPMLHARIVSRDGYGKPMGTYYLVSVGPKTAKIVIGHDELAKHTWPNILGLAVSHDDKILKAATTALIFAAEEETEIVEATPRVTDEGTIALPAPETLPHGYLTTSDLDRNAALKVWSHLTMLAAESPKIALVLGASAFGPFLAALGNRQPHIVSLHGEMAQGKSVTMRAAASIWGNPGSKAEAGVCESWNQSKLAPTSYLGELGVLPAFFDETGMAGNLTAADWGKRIFDICEGASRGRPAANGRPGFVRGRSWYGILMSAGNNRLMDGIGAGGMAGTQRRVVELATPFTHSREHSDALEGLYPQAFGHLGLEILERHSSSTVGEFLQDAAEMLGDVDFESPVAQEVVKHLVSHIAGAAMIDDIVGTGGLLAAAATDGALEYLQEWEEPLHDADRILDAIHDSLIQEPACWPTVAQHLENGQAPSGAFNDTTIARHGIALKTKGLVANDSAWIAVIPSVWKEVCEALGVDSDVACRELTKRNVLIRQGSSHKPGARNFTSMVKVGHSPKRFYKLTYPVLEADGEISSPMVGSSSPAAGDGMSPQPAEEQLMAQDLFNDNQAAIYGSVTAPVTPKTPEVTAPVTAPKPPLTCEVTAVTAVTAPPTHVDAREAIKPSGISGHVRLGPDEPRPPCVVCGEPAGQTVGGQPIHLGSCLDGLAPTNTPEPANEEIPTETGPIKPVEPAAARPVPEPARPLNNDRQPRFSAPAAVVDVDQLYLAGQAVRPLPEINHLGDLALLTSRDQLRLGWGGGEDRFPDPGQIWLMAGALEQLGFPTSMPLPEKALTRAQRAKASQKMFAKLDEHPMVVGALDTGWELGQGGHLAVWTRLWHPELLPGGAFIVAMPWHHIEGVPLFAGNPGPAELVDRLHSFAQHVGVSYRLTTAATGLDLIDHHRPPRRTVDDEIGSGRGRVALVRNTPAELPPWRKKTSDARFTGLEQDFSWWRTWTTLTDSEKALKYVHGYDRNASYLTPWQSIDLGVEDLIHRVGDDATWNGKEAPGYYLVDAWEWPTWGLPDPGNAAGARVGKGRMWVTVHTLRQLAAHGIEPQIHESYTWGVTARYLEGPGKTLANARKALTAVQEASESDQAVLTAIKMLYSTTVGKLAEREHSETFHLWRPDWRDHVIGATKTAILRTLSQVAESTGTHPLAVDRDAIFYASDEADPWAAWPGDPNKLGPNLGSWKPIGSTTLADWGPEYLAKRTGRWPYADAVNALVDDLTGEQ